MVMSLNQCMVCWIVLYKFEIYDKNAILQILPHTQTHWAELVSKIKLSKIQFDPSIIICSLQRYAMETAQRANGRHFSTDPIKWTKQICAMILKKCFQESEGKM